MKAGGRGDSGVRIPRGTVKNRVAVDNHKQCGSVDETMRPEREVGARSQVTALCGEKHGLMRKTKGQPCWMSIWLDHSG